MKTFKGADGTLRVKILHDVDGGCGELIEAKIVTDGTARCDDECGRPDVPIVVWTSPVTEMDYSVCEECIDQDDFVRFV